VTCAGSYYPATLAVFAGVQNTHYAFQGKGVILTAVTAIFVELKLQFFSQDFYVTVVIDTTAA
jgi:hypothetical protein